MKNLVVFAKNLVKKVKSHAKISDKVSIDNDLSTTQPENKDAAEKIIAANLLEKGKTTKGDDGKNK